MSIDLWANFLKNEKMTPKAVDDPMVLVAFCEKLAAIRGPKVGTHKDKLESRRFVCETAINNGLDLPSLCKIGRGLLDMWLKVYRERFGSTIGTAVQREASRRDIVTKLSKERRHYEQGTI